MLRRFIPTLTLLAAAFSAPHLASATPIALGYVSFDVTGTNLAEFDIFNETGANASTLPDTTFPVATPLSFSNLSLLVTYGNGSTATFASNYFTLSSDALSFNGVALSTLAPGTSGLNGAVSALLNGQINQSTITMIDGSFAPVSTGFSATIADSAGLADGDYAVIYVSSAASAVATPEPGTWALVVTGGSGLLFFIRRRGPFRLGWLSLPALLLFAAACARPLVASTVSLSGATAPNSGAAGTTSVNVTGSSFPSGTISPANVNLVLATTCGTPGTSTTATSVTNVIGTSKRVQFVLPGSLTTGTYFVSISGSTSTGASFASSNCAQVSVTAASPAISFSASSLSFPNQPAGGASAAQTVNLINNGTAPLNVSSISVTGAAANLYSQTNNCPASLASGSFCTMSVTFSPRIAASSSALLSVASNATPGTQSVALSGSATAAALTIDTTTATDWKISNGTMTYDWNSTNGRIFGIHLAGYSDNLVDLTNSAGGIYMDNSGFGTGATSATYTNAGTYLDWSYTVASSSTNAYTYSEHFVITPNDPGVHLYFVANHKTTDIAGSIGQVQWVYRSNLTDFPNTYSVNPDLSNPGPVTVPLPPASENFSTDPGRAVQDATVDLHGLPVPAGFARGFYTKYDYSSYNYLHQAHGVYGSTFGNWAFFPSNESLVGGPTKQNLIFTGNLTIVEAYSSHYESPITLTTPAGTASSRLFGPFYIHFNTIGQAYNATGSTIATPDDMYQDAVQSGSSFRNFYDTENQLLASGYVPSTARGSVSVQIQNVTGAPKTAWAVLSDPAKNHQLSSQGYQYWADISSTGTTTFTGVVPGTYRLSVYDLGQFGELRQDNVVVAANQTTTVPTVAFVPETFGEQVFTIGTPDRSSHEFLHGHDPSGHDDREYWGTWNYWADFAANSGAVVYNATSGPNGPASNDPAKWNYNHWGVFDPGLYGGVYNQSDDTTDGYTYVVPAYVATLPGATGTKGVTTRTPNWQVHFATPSDAANFQYAVLSVALACDYGSYVTSLNGTARTWSYRTAVYSDCSVRSGLSGYTQWLTFVYPVSALKAVGLDNLLTINVSQVDGAMDDALRLELTNTLPAPATTGFFDYEYISTSSTANNIPANDTVPNP